MNALVRWLKRIVLSVIALLVIVALGLSLFLPDEYTVNVTLGDFFGAESVDAATAEQRLQVAEGYHLRVFASGVVNARAMLLSQRGDLLVSTPNSGEVIVLAADANSDGQHDGRRVLLEGLNGPHGMAFYQTEDSSWLYVAETDGVGRIRYNQATGAVSGEFERVITGLPAGGNHWTRTIHFGPDGLLYLTVGSSCNVCEETTPLRAAMMRYQPDGSGVEIYASGLRNTVGFAWDQQGRLFGVDNGRDLLGDDIPPEEMNEIKQGQFYGWPYAYGDKIADPEFGPGNEDKVAASLAPAHEFGAHMAPLGITFLSADSHPETYQQAAIVTLHGSWNRTRKAGYKLVSLHWQADGSILEKDFVTGFEVDEDVIGRPVDVVEAGNGDLFVSDDYSGTIYQISTRKLAVPKTGVGQVKGQSAVVLVEPDLPLEQVAELDVEGEALLGKYRCTSCHASTTYLAYARRNLNEKYTRASLAQFMVRPTPPMPVFPLSEEERLAIAVHLLERY